MKSSVGSVLLLLLVILSGCGASTQGNSEPGGSADWAMNFVVWDGKAYEIVDEEVPQDAISDKIGEVTLYSDQEGVYSDGFSNKLPEGTVLYAAKDTDTSEYIAVSLADGRYAKAISRGKYSG